MNFDINDILAAIQEGQNPDDLARSFTDALNGAIQKKKEKEEKEAAAQAAVAQRKERLRALFLAALDFARTYMPKLVEDITPADFEGEKLDKLDDAMVEVYDEMYGEGAKKVFPFWDSMWDVKVKTPKGEKESKGQGHADLDAEIAKLMKELGLSE